MSSILSKLKERTIQTGKKFAEFENERKNVPSHVLEGRNASILANNLANLQNAREDKEDYLNDISQGITQLDKNTIDQLSANIKREEDRYNASFYNSAAHYYRSEAERLVTDPNMHLKWLQINFWYSIFAWGLFFCHCWNVPSGYTGDYVEYLYCGFCCNDD